MTNAQHTPGQSYGQLVRKAGGSWDGDTITFAPHSLVRFSSMVNRGQLGEHQTERAIGSWLSAALEDDTVCAEMKADIRAWMEWIDSRAKATGSKA